MKLRSAALLGAAATVLSLVTTVPAHAAPTDPVTNLKATAVQTPGVHDSWTVTAQWDDNDAPSFSVVIADHADGVVTNGAHLGSRTTRESSVSIRTDQLLDRATYWIVVHVPGESEPAIVSFDTGALDTTPPTGQYRLDRTSAYLTGSPFSDTEATAEFQITEVAGGDAVTRTVDAGDGTPATRWTSGRSFLLSYTKPGTFTPRVTLTDGFGNTRSYKLAAVHVLADTVAPVVHITTPAKPRKVASWRTIRGTATDTGTGVMLAGAFVMEKRGSVWWAYDFEKKTWLKGTSSRRKTESKSKASPAMFAPSASGAWRTPRIKGLTRGTLYVEAVAFDEEFNVGGTRITRKIG